MATKNTPAELQAEGFAPEQFGTDATGWATYAQELLDEVTLVVKHRAGDTNYASADPIIAGHVKRAERFLAASELWLRRMNRDSAETLIGNQEAKAVGFTRFRTFSNDYKAKFEAEIAALPSSISVADNGSSSPGFGAVISSPFEDTSA